jgi:CTP synthase (UTP-ammonia lyase)
VIVEIARNVLRVEHADHAETNPDAQELVITPLECSLVGQAHPVNFVAGSRVAGLYGVSTTVEPYYCNYGLNPDYEPRLRSAGLRVTARDVEGRARAVELEGHPFFLGTLYVFQARDHAGGPHPITRALVASANAAKRAISRTTP